MAREKEGFRESLARIDEAFPGKELLTVTDASSFLGIDRRTLKKYYGSYFQKINKRPVFISKPDLARAISV